MDNCTRYAFTDGHCQQIENGCFGCPGKFIDLSAKHEATRKESAFCASLAIYIPLGVICASLAFGLAYKVKEGMERKAAYERAEARR